MHINYFYKRQFYHPENFVGQQKFANQPSCIFNLKSKAALCLLTCLFFNEL
jgi:hypothetical protein